MEIPGIRGGRGQVLSDARRTMACGRCADKRRTSAQDDRMKAFRWNLEKNRTLRLERGISFESIVVAIESGGLLDILAHPNPAKYPNQRVLVVACDGYAWLVPFVEEADCFFLKTVIPSRKATRDYLNQGETDAESR